jgi:hypothetical protein
MSKSASHAKATHGCEFTKGSGSDEPQSGLWHAMARVFFLFNTYKAIDLRTGGTWTLMDSEHVCGGA